MNAKNLPAIAIASIFSLFFFSCVKDNGNYSTKITQTHDASLRVVAHLKWLDPKTGNLNDSLLSGVAIGVYSNEADRDDNISPDQLRYTDTSGVAAFDDLSADYYYVRATVSPYGLQQDDVSTPDHTTSWVNVYFYKY